MKIPMTAEDRQARSAHAHASRADTPADETEAARLSLRYAITRATSVAAYAATVLAGARQAALELDPDTAVLDIPEKRRLIQAATALAIVATQLGDPDPLDPDYDPGDELGAVAHHLRGIEHVYDFIEK